MTKNKKAMSAWIWVLIILILISIGIIIYVLSGGDAGTAISSGTSTGSSIPQPPALPSG